MHPDFVPPWHHVVLRRHTLLESHLCEGETARCSIDPGAQHGRSCWNPRWTGPNLHRTVSMEAEEGQSWKSLTWGKNVRKKQI